MPLGRASGETPESPDPDSPIGDYHPPIKSYKKGPLSAYQDGKGDIFTLIHDPDPPGFILNPEECSGTIPWLDFHKLLENRTKGRRYAGYIDLPVRYLDREEAYLSQPYPIIRVRLEEKPLAPVKNAIYVERNKRYYVIADFYSFYWPFKNVLILGDWKGSGSIPIDDMKAFNRTNCPIFTLVSPLPKP